MAKVTCTKKLAIIYTVVVIIVAAAIVVGVVFGILGQGSTGPIKVNVEQLSVNSDANALRRRAGLSNFNLADAIPASNGKAWALIDGLKLDLDCLRFSYDGGMGRDKVLNWAPSRRPIEVGNGVKTSAISDTADVSKIKNALTTQFLGSI